MHIFKEHQDRLLLCQALKLLLQRLEGFLPLELGQQIGNLVGI